MRYVVRSYDYINHPYPAARAVLVADPLRLFTRATRVGAADAGDTLAQVHVKLGSLDVAANVAISVGPIEDAIKYGRPGTNVALTWSHPEHPGLFPAMTAMLSIYPLSPTETQLELDGHYEPPLGVLGAAFDSIVGHRLARTAIHGFIREIASCMRGAEPALEQSAAAG